MKRNPARFSACFSNVRCWATGFATRYKGEGKKDGKGADGKGKDGGKQKGKDMGGAPKGKGKGDMGAAPKGKGKQDQGAPWGKVTWMMDAPRRACQRGGVPNAI